MCLGSAVDPAVAGKYAEYLPRGRITAPTSIESCAANARVPAAACLPLPGIAGADKPPLAPRRSLAMQGSLTAGDSLLGRSLPGIGWDLDDYVTAERFPHVDSYLLAATPDAPDPPVHADRVGEIGG